MKSGGQASLAAPDLVASAMLCLIPTWAEFSFALILTYTLKSQTVSIAISGLTSGRGTYFDALAAAGSLALLPVFLFSLFVERYLVQGLTAGAVKG